MGNNLSNPVRLWLQASQQLKKKSNSPFTKTESWSFKPAVQETKNLQPISRRRRRENAPQTIQKIDKSPSLRLRDSITIHNITPQSGENIQLKTEEERITRRSARKWDESHYYHGLRRIFNEWLQFLLRWIWKESETMEGRNTQLRAIYSRDPSIFQGAHKSYPRCLTVLGRSLLPSTMWTLSSRRGPCSLPCDPCCYSKADLSDVRTSFQLGHNIQCNQRLRRQKYMGVSH